MTLSKEQLSTDPKTKFMKFLWLSERDLLECARRWEPWRQRAHELGFTDLKIDASWNFPDAGRQIQYAEMPDG